MHLRTADDLTDNGYATEVGFHREKTLDLQPEPAATRWPVNDARIPAEGKHHGTSTRTRNHEMARERRAKAQVPFLL